MPRQAILFLCRRNTWTLLLAFAIGSAGRAHSYYNTDYHVDIQQVDARYGLESVMVRSIYQDKKGFIWIATPVGLARFNGHEFLYFKDPKIIGAINSGIEIYGEIEGKLIIAENRPILINPGQEPDKYLFTYLLDPVSGKLLQFSASIGKHAPFKGHIKSLNCYKENLYVGTHNGQIYTYANGKWSLFYSDPYKAPIRELLMDSPEKPFWVMAGDTLSYITPEGRRLHRQYLDLSTSFWGLKYYDGKVWIYTIQPGEKTAAYYLAPGQPLQSKHPAIGDLSRFEYIHIDRVGRIWLWKKNAFHVFDQAGQKIVEVPAQTSMLNIPYVYFDANNRAWVSQRQEFNIVRITKKPFKRVLDNPSVSARQLVEVRPSVVWAASYGGLFEFSTDNPTSVSNVPVPTPLMFGLCQAGPYVWIGIHGEYLVRMDSRNKKYDKWYLAGQYQGNNRGFIHLLNPFVDKKGNVWVGSSRGVFLVDTLRRHIYRDVRFNKYGLEQCEVNFQWENNEGIWTATNKGLYLLDRAKGVKNYFLELARYSISYIHEKPNGVFWMATREYGLIKWERNTRLVTHFEIPEGIVKPNLHAIFEDKKGRFWMPSDRGLIYFDPVTHFVQIFFESDGLTHDEFNRRSYLKLSDGSFIFGGIAGINHFEPGDFDELDRSPSVLRITDYDVWDPEQRKFISQTGQLLQNKKITLGTEQISFQIKFALLDYDKLTANRYAYKIEPMDKDWIQIRENHLRFTSLPYGKFTLRIKGATAKGVWSPNELSIPIEVQRPFYLNGWFFALCALFLLSAVWAGVRWRLYRLAKIKKLLESEVAARTNELEKDRQTIAQQNRELEALNHTKDHLMAVIGHELRGPMLSIQNIGDSISYLLKNGQGDKAATLGEHIKHRVFSVRMLLDNLLYWGLSQAGKQEVFREEVALHPLMIESVELVEFWIASKKLNLQISCPNDLNLHTDRNILRIVLLNLLTNAIKFTHEGGSITLKASRYMDSNCIIEVADTGIGMDTTTFSPISSGIFRSAPGTKGEKGTGMGLALCQKLLESLDGQLTLETHTSKGCTFYILLPHSCEPPMHTSSKSASAAFLSP